VDPAAHTSPVVVGILLAAGRSARFGSTKQLARWDGEALVHRIAREARASTLAGLVVVLGHDAEDVSRTIADLDVQVTFNADYAAGQSTSIRRGLDALPPEASAAMFITCDQPLLSTAVIDRLLAAFREGGADAVVPAVHGSRRSPVIFAKALFADLRALRGDTGGRGVLLEHAATVREVAFPDGAPFQDVDTPDAFLALRETPRTPEPGSQSV
jgi:molybdenum cofactor cytidylyltransferase